MAGNMLWRYINFRILYERTIVVALLQHECCHIPLVARFFLSYDRNAGISYRLIEYFNSLIIASNEGRAFPATDSLKAGISSTFGIIWNDFGIDKASIGPSDSLDFHEENVTVRESLEADDASPEQFASYLRELPDYSSPVSRSGQAMTE
jgi:hypothetical protein